MMFLHIPALAIVLLVVLRTIHRLYLKVVVSPRYRQLFLRWYPVVEIVLWVGFVYWSLAQFFGDRSYYPYLTVSLTVLLVALMGWYFLRDFFAGFILRSENSLETGRQIKVGTTEGVILKTGYRSLLIITRSGEQIRIPYSVIARGAVVQPAAGTKLHNPVISLDVSSRQPPDRLQHMLMNRLLQMPWVLPAVQPELTLSLIEAGRYRVDISLRVLNEEARLKTQTQLMEFVEKEL